MQGSDSAKSSPSRASAPMFVSEPLVETPFAAAQHLSRTASIAVEFVRGSSSLDSRASSLASELSGRSPVSKHAVHEAFPDPLGSPISVLEAFKSFREDIDVLSLDSVSEEVLADADFLFDLSEDDMSDIGPIPALAESEHRQQQPSLPALRDGRSAAAAIAAASYRVPDTPRSPFEEALDRSQRSFASACSGSCGLPDLEALAAARSIAGQNSLRSAESIGSPRATAAAGGSLPHPFCLGDDAVSSLRLEDLQSSASAASAISRLASARARASVAAAAQLPASPAVAALEAAASSLADNLHSCLARCSPRSQLPRSWSSTPKVCLASLLHFRPHHTSLASETSPSVILGLLCTCASVMLVSMSSYSDCRCCRTRSTYCPGTAWPRSWRLRRSLRPRTSSTPLSASVAAQPPSRASSP